MLVMMMMMIEWWWGGGRMYCPICGYLSALAFGRHGDDGGSDGIGECFPP